MGLLDFFFESDPLKKHKETLTNMYVQESERKYAIQALHDLALGEAGSEAVEVLLCRFDETGPNTTVDVDEKEYVYDVLVEIGETSDLDVAGIIIEHLAESEEKINWPLKALTDLLEYEEMIDVVKRLLDTCSEGYQQNPEKKQELMLQSAELRDPELAEKLVGFLDDPNEPIRFLAVDAVAHQEFDEIIEEPLRERLYEEDSIRIVNKITEVFAENRDWKIPEDEQADVEKAIPEEFGIHKEGHIYQRRI